MATNNSQSAESVPEISEKSGSQFKHHEGLDHQHQDAAQHHQELGKAGYDFDTDELPKGYYTSMKFIGTFIGICFNLMGSTAGFAIIGPVLGQINAAIGPGS